MGRLVLWGMLGLLVDFRVWHLPLFTYGLKSGLIESRITLNAKTNYDKADVPGSLFSNEKLNYAKIIDLFTIIVYNVLS